MRRLVLVLLLLPAPAAAEPNWFRWPESQQPIADWLSYGTVGAALTWRAVDAWQAPDRRRALTCAASEVVLTLTVTEAIKRGVPRWRPDRSDQKSHPSAHTALAAVAQPRGWRVGFSVSTAYLRGAADKHFLTDTLAGLLIGTGASLLCAD